MEKLNQKYFLQYFKQAVLGNIMKSVGIVDSNYIYKKLKFLGRTFIFLLFLIIFFIKNNETQIEFF